MTLGNSGVFINGGGGQGTSFLSLVCGELMCSNTHSCPRPKTMLLTLHLLKPWAKLKSPLYAWIMLSVCCRDSKLKQCLLYKTPCCKFSKGGLLCSAAAESHEDGTDPKAASLATHLSFLKQAAECTFADNVAPSHEQANSKGHHHYEEEATHNRRGNGWDLGPGMRLRDKRR